MPYFVFIWDDHPGGNVEHLAEHGVTTDEAEQVVVQPIEVGPNRRHPDRMFAVGHTASGRRLGVSYLHLDETTLLVITAFELE